MSRPSKAIPLVKTDEDYRIEQVEQIRSLVHDCLAPAKAAVADAKREKPQLDSVIGLATRLERKRLMAGTATVDDDGTARPVGRPLDDKEQYHQQHLEQAFLVDRLRLARSMISMAVHLPATPTSAAVTAAAIEAISVAQSACPARQDIKSLAVPPKPPKPPLWSDPRPLGPLANTAHHIQVAKDTWPRVMAAAKRLAKTNMHSRAFVQDYLHEPWVFALTQFAFEWSGSDHREEVRCYLDVLFPPPCARCKKAVVVSAEHTANRCNRCRKAWYCCFDCASADWQDHGKLCPMPTKK
jgi:hypothetical protein